MYALYGNTNTYYCLLMPNYSLNMSNCLNYANYAEEPNLHIVSVFLQNISRMYDVIYLVRKKHIPH